jgi:hypothetical protein
LSGTDNGIGQPKADVSPTVPARAEAIIWPALFVLIVVYGLCLLRGGYLHYEGQFFLSNYLDGRGLLSRIFSSHFNEWDCYQGRELSFVFGLLDARAIAVAAMLGVPMLYSVTSIVSITGMAIVLWRMLPRMAPRLSRTDAGLIVALLLLSPPLALSSYYYRPTKALAGLFLVLLASRCVRILVTNTENKSDSRDALFLSGFATLMGLSDRQGVFLILVAVAVVVCAWGVTARKPRLVLSALFVALIVNAVWTLAPGPAISTMVDGSAPDTWNQHIALRYTFGNFIHYARAAGLWRDHVSFFFGSWGVVVSIACLILICVAFWMRAPEDPARPFKKMRRPFLTLLIVCGMLLALYVMMVAKLTSVIWDDSRRVYYWIPEMIVLTIVVAAAFDRALAHSIRLRLPITIALGAMIITSVGALPRHRDIVISGDQRIQIAESSRVRQCMRGTGSPIAGFDLSAGGRQACTSVRLAAFGSIGPGSRPAPATPNPLLYCSQRRRR